MKALHFIFIKLTLGLFLGISIGYYFLIPLSLSSAIFLFSLLLLAIVHWLANQRKINAFYFGFISFISFILLGIIITRLHNEKSFSNHYSHLYSENNTITFRIRTQLKSSSYHDKYIVDILKIDTTEAIGKTLLNIEKDSNKTNLKIDAIYSTSEALQSIPTPVNPNTFNYKIYLERQYIYHQIYATNQRLLPISKKKHTVFGYADALRETLISKLEQHAFKPNELSIIKALILGQRQDINKELKTNYINAGVIHILAISGLHIGILLMLLNFFFKPLHYFKHGKLLKVILIFITLWSFAIIAGLSASVVRAVTMFSIVAVAMHLKRISYIYNTLAISIFFILLFRPLLIFDVGFQLSYVAVIAIVSIQPLLANLWEPKYWFTKKIWSIFTVTIAAQLGVLPLSLYYFHQFPSLFFITNLIIIPFLGFILGLGILITLLAYLNCLPSFLAEGYGKIISLMNAFIDFIAQQHQFLFEGISFNALQVISAYIILITLVQFWIKYNFKTLRLVLFSILLFQGSLFYTHYKNNSNCFTIFHKNRYSVIGKKSNNKLILYSNLDSLSQFKSIKTYTISNYIKTINTSALKSVYKTDNNLFLVIDSIPTYKVKTFTPNYIVLRNSPKVNLSRIIDSLRPKQIIADGSNYKSYIKRWKIICKKEKLPFHYTGEKGAFMLCY